MVGKVGGQNAGINISAVNQSISHKYEAMTGKPKENNRIIAVISPEGKKQNMIGQLMKQKQDLMERMNELSGSGQDNGISIQDRMKEYQKQMEALDEQIAQLQMQPEDDGEDEETTGIYEKPMTKEEAESKQMNALVNLYSGTDHVETIASVQNQVDGRTNILEGEIKSGYGNIEAKQKEIADLKRKSAKLTSQIGEQIGDTNVEIESVREEELNAQTVSEDTDNGDDTKIGKRES